MEDSVFLKQFSKIKDKRQNTRKRHLLIDIIALAICATISGATGWEDIEAYGKEKESWLKTFLSLPHGIPSHDTISRVFSFICPLQFQECFIGWIQEIYELMTGDIIPIDGKALKGSHRKSRGKKALHILNAWSTQHQLVLGQIAVDEKSNEITAVPTLLKMLTIKGSTVTLDALNCQRKIASQIIEQEGNYVMAVKENQGKLYHSIVSHFQKAEQSNYEAMVYSFSETLDGIEHGRIERRQCTVLPVMYLPLFRFRWKGLKSLVRTQNERVIKATGEVQRQTLYYISSLSADAKVIAHAVRTHWCVENQLHWSLDCTFDEDQCRIRKDIAVENFAWLRRMALSLLKKDTSYKASIRRKQFKALMNNQYLAKILSLTS